MRKLSERTVILGRLGLILVAGFLTITIASYVVSRDAIRRSIAEQSLPLTGDNIYSEIQKDILRPVFISSLMANDTFLRDWILGGEKDVAQIDHYLKETKEKYGAITAFLVSERTRKHYTAQGELPSVREDAFRDRWYFRVRRMKEAYETNVDPDLATRDTLTIFINFRVMDYHGNFIGATGVGLALDTVKNIIDRYQERFGREIYFVDPRGDVVLAGKSMRGRHDSIRTTPGIRDIANAILKGGTTPTQLEYKLGGATAMVNSRFIPELGWYLVVDDRTNEEIMPIMHVLQFNLGISAGITLLVLAIAFVTIRGYQARLERLAQNAVSTAAAETMLAREQQQFVAMVSHEFRTPLATIDASLQSLRRFANQMPEELLSRYRKIRRASQQLQALIDNYLTEDRLRQAVVMPTTGPVDIFGLVSRCAWRVEWHNLTIDADGLPATIEGDAELLKIAFSNLIDNAMKYSEEGGNIRIEGESADGFAEIRVRDSGIGISPEDLPRIFDKYFRARGNKAGGSGLGLHLVKRIVELHGGSISAESAPGQGTTMRVRLPVGAGTPPEAPPA